MPDDSPTQFCRRRRRRDRLIFSFLLILAVALGIGVNAGFFYFDALASSASRGLVARLSSGPANFQLRTLHAPSQCLGDDTMVTRRIEFPSFGGSD